MSGFIHIMSVLAILAVAGAGFAHMLGSAGVRDRLFGAAFVLIALLLLLPGVAAGLDGCRGAMDVHLPTPDGGRFFVVGLAAVGHVALAIEIIRRRGRPERSSRDRDRTRTRTRSRVAASETDSEEELP